MRINTLLGRGVVSSLLGVGFLVAAVSGCGRYMRPIPPESVSPQAVQELQVQGGLQGVRLAWASPTKDRRGKELQDLGGYRVERKTIGRTGDEVNTRVRFEKLAFLEDRSVSELAKQREILRAQDKPSHRAKVDPALQRFEFVDASARPGEQYLYRVVPQSYYGDGAVQFVARVLYRGDSSEVSMLSGLTSDGELIESVLGDEDEE